MTTVFCSQAQVQRKQEVKRNRKTADMNSLLSRRDTQVQAMEQTLNHAEKNLGEICSILASYTRKTAKLRDKADLLVTQLFDFSTTEGPEFQVGLKNLAEDLAMVQDYRQAQVERLETKVVAPLRAYGDTVKKKKMDLNKFSADLKREQKELQKLEKIRQRSPADRQNIAELNAQKASSNAQHSIKQLEETITKFQCQKLEDIKKIFIDFITVEMHFHAKALEVYTHTYYNLEAVDTQKDLQLFSSRIRMSDSQAWSLNTSSSPLINHYSRFPTTSSKDQGLSSPQTSKSGQSHRPQHSQHEKLPQRPHTNLHRQSGIEEEEEEEEEDEEIEEEEESEAEAGLGPHTGRQSYAAQYAQMHRHQK